MGSRPNAHAKGVKQSGALGAKDVFMTVSYRRRHLSLLAGPLFVATDGPRK